MKTTVEEKKLGGGVVSVYDQKMRAEYLQSLPNSLF